VRHQSWTSRSYFLQTQPVNTNTTCGTYIPSGGGGGSNAGECGVGLYVTPERLFNSIKDSIVVN
jgi:hypothetical protein